MSELDASLMHKMRLLEFKEKKVRSIEQQGKKYDDPRVARKCELRFMLYGKDKKKTKKKLRAARKKLHEVKARQHEIRKQRRADKRLARNKVKLERNEKYALKTKALEILDLKECRRKCLGAKPSTDRKKKFDKYKNTEDTHMVLAKRRSSDPNKPEQMFIARVSTSDFLSHMFKKQLNLTSHSTFPTTADHPTILNQPTTANHSTIPSQPTTTDDPTTPSQPTTSDHPTILSQPTTVDHAIISSQATISDTPTVSNHPTILDQTVF